MALDTEEEQVEKLEKIWNSYKWVIILVIILFRNVFCI